MSELAKIDNIRADAQAIGEFLEWLGHHKHIGLAELKRPYPDNPGYSELIYTRQSVEDLLNEYFGVDQKQAERERKAALDELRRINGLVDRG
jgi:hypothetical protein